jgi:hypothetical protein
VSVAIDPMKKQPPATTRIPSVPVTDPAEEDRWRAEIEAACLQETFDTYMHEIEEIMQREPVGPAKVFNGITDDDIAFAVADIPSQVRVLEIIKQGFEAFQELAALVGHPSARKHWLAMCRHAGAGAPRGVAIRAKTRFFCVSTTKPLARIRQGRKAALCPDFSQSASLLERGRGCIGAIARRPLRSVFGPSLSNEPEDPQAVSRKKIP